MIGSGQGQGVPEGGVEIAQGAGCSWCGETAAPERSGEFMPMCPACARSYPLGVLGMNGSHPLTHAAIDEVMARTSPGNYALGYMDGATFMVFYVGRSDSDVKERLHRWVGAPTRYARYAPSARAAWGSHRGGGMPVDAPVTGRVGSCSDSSYTHFAYSYADSADAAFEKECRNYEDLGGADALDNDTEPAMAADPA